MDENRLRYLHEKYIINQMSPGELEEWKVALGSSDTDQRIQQLMDVHWLSLKAEMGHPVSQERSEKMFEEIIAHKKHRKTPWPLWPRIAVAAAVAVVIFGSAMLYYYNQNTITEQVEYYANDIAPGKNGATLTLADGRKILINDALAGNIADQSGVKILKDKDGQISYEIIDVGSGKLEYNTLSTTRGEQTRVRLPDGSLVFLNAASALKYPTSFATLKERKVELDGEGYFEVAKDKAHPFIVRSATQEVEVLGTHFNINSYEDEPMTKTALIEGSVKVSQFSSVEKKMSNRTGYGKMLRPGEQLQVYRDGKFIVSKVDAEEAIAWKDGKFIFNDEPLENIMRKVARWYNVDVTYQGVDPKERFWGSVSRFGNVSKVLEKLELTGDVHFKIEGRKIHVTP